MTVRRDDFEVTENSVSKLESLVFHSEREPVPLLLEMLRFKLNHGTEVSIDIDILFDLVAKELNIHMVLRWIEAALSWDHALACVLEHPFLREKSLSSDSVVVIDTLAHKMTVKHLLKLFFRSSNWSWHEVLWSKILCTFSTHLAFHQLREVRTWPHLIESRRYAYLEQLLDFLLHFVDVNLRQEALSSARRAWRILLILAAVAHKSWTGLTQMKDLVVLLLDRLK